MSKNPIRLPARQAGFTLIELVIVIVIIGIMAAVAVFNLSGTTNEARISKQQATLGALKGAWSSQFATLKVAPTCAEVAAAMVDPTCTSGASGITCTGVETAAGGGSALFGCAANISATPAALTCATTGC